MRMRSRGPHPFVASTELPCRACVSGRQRRAVKSPRFGSSFGTRPAIGIRKALRHKGLASAGPPIAYVIAPAAPPGRMPRCRSNWPASEQKNTGSFAMSAAHKPAQSHRNAFHAASARKGRSAPFRCLARGGHAQHAARCMHASAERRLQARSPQGVRGGPGRWPFHACAICAPPCCRASQH
ncbi:hypothetical protein D9M72_219620 [compost metagenome]